MGSAGSASAWAVSSMADIDWIDEHLELYAIDGLPDDEHAEMERSLADLPESERRRYEQQIVDTQAAMNAYAGRYAAAPPADLRGRILTEYTAAQPVVPIRSRRRRVAAAKAFDPRLRARQRILAPGGPIGIDEQGQAGVGGDEVAQPAGSGGGDARGQRVHPRIGLAIDAVAEPEQQRVLAQPHRAPGRVHPGSRLRSRRTRSTSA